MVRAAPITPEPIAGSSTLREDGTEVRLGVFLSSTKTRRAKLAAGGLPQFAGLGLNRGAA
jgi:hypothetical protein